MATTINKKRKSFVNIISNLLILFSVFVLAFIFYPVTKEEIKYQVNKTISKEENLVPSNKDFSIVIPKISAVAPIIKNVDPTNKNIFLPALKKGVAHADGTSLPNEKGNVYLFAHSTDAFYNVGAYNAIFYLIGKLEKDDEIKIYYEQEEYIYKVTEKKVVNASDTSYLTDKKTDNILTLQTCYPPGTTLKRLIVIANLDK
jgi:sortase A